MQKIIRIDGMSCGHCSARVEKALSALGDVKVSVDLKAGTASSGRASTACRLKTRKIYNLRTETADEMRYTVNIILCSDA